MCGSVILYVLCVCRNPRKHPAVLMKGQPSLRPLGNWPCCRRCWGSWKSRDTECWSSHRYVFTQTQTSAHSHTQTPDGYLPAQMLNWSRDISRRLSGRLWFQLCGCTGNQVFMKTHASVSLYLSVSSVFRWLKCSTYLKIFWIMKVTSTSELMEASRERWGKKPSTALTVRHRIKCGKPSVSSAKDE